MNLLISVEVDGVRLDLYDPRPVFSGYFVLNTEVGMPPVVDWDADFDDIKHHGRCVLLHGTTPEVARQVVDRFERRP